MRKSWFIGAVVGALAVATVGGVALAQSATSTPQAGATATATPQTFSSRLAKQLGINEDTLNAAITKVRRQQADDMVSAMLAKAVAAGKLTQAQADQYLAWWKSRPDAPAGSLGGHKAFGRFGHFAMPPGKPGTPNTPPAMGTFQPPFGGSPFGQGGPGFQTGQNGRGPSFGVPRGGMAPWMTPPSPPQSGLSA